MGAAPAWEMQLQVQNGAQLALPVNPCTCSHTAQAPPYSHSMVAGGFELMSYTTRLTPGTSLTIRDEIFASTS